MASRVMKRLLHAVLALWAAVTLVWVFMQIIPGDPARWQCGRNPSSSCIERLRAEWGLDRPPLERYLIYLGNVATGDLGRSYEQDLPVTTIVLAGFRRTIWLAGAALLLAASGGILAGVAAARRGGAIGAAVTAGTLAGVSIPSFWLGLMLMILFASTLRLLPVSGFGPGIELLGLQIPSPSHLVLPALALACFPAALIARVTRAAMQEQQRAEHIRAGRARGVREIALAWRHAFRNALGPVMTLVGLLLASLLGGAVATETVFAWPGLGRVVFDAISARDLPVVEGAVLMMTATFVAIHAAVDLAHGLVDPRIEQR